MCDSLINPLDLELLVQRIREGRCVPFLGAGVNARSERHGYEGLALGAEVARRLADRLRLEGHKLDSLDLAEVAQALEVLTDRWSLIEDVREILSRSEVGPSPALRTLARLPFKLLLTTNYDQLLERALEKANKDYTVIVQPVSGFAPGDAQAVEDAFQGERVIVYKMHGTFRGHEAEPEEAIVITEDDYIERLGALAGEQIIPGCLAAKMYESTWLLLGFSARDWDFRLLWKRMFSDRWARHRSFIVIREDPSSFWARYLQELGFHLCNMDVHEFAEQLEGRCVEWYG
jgi:hypothetical protein